MGALAAGRSPFRGWFGESDGLEGLDDIQVAVVAVSFAALIFAVVDRWIEWGGLLPVAGALGFLDLGVALSSGSSSVQTSLRESSRR